MSLDASILDVEIYGERAVAKHARLLADLNRLTQVHYEGCPAYRQILDGYGRVPGAAERIEDIPFLPVRLFKKYALKSVPDDQVFKTLTSSGTTGQTPSRIFLDTETAQLQARALVKIMQTYLGPRRLPMLVIDHPSVVRDRSLFSARGAGILGLSNFGRQHTYALTDDTMEIDLEKVQAFAEKHAGQPVLMFGFTFMVWEYFIEALRRANIRLNFTDAVLIHSGGWKKLQNKAVSAETFKAGLAEWAGVRRVHDFYGMVEQTGSIFVECEHGHLHASAFSDVVVRRPLDWKPCAPGEEGVVQVLSQLPRSYPGHSLLTEDRGILHGEDDCACGRKGRHFSILGRVPMAEMRGCSDTHAPAAVLENV